MILSGLPQRLHLDLGVDQHKIEQCLQAANEKRHSFVSQALQMQLVSSARMAELAAEEFGLAVFDLAAFDRKNIPSDVVSIELIKKHNVLPLNVRAGRLFIAQSDPSLIDAVSEIRFQTGMLVESVVVDHDQLSSAVHKFLSQDDEPASGELEQLDDTDLGKSIEQINSEINDDINSDEIPVVHFVNQILLTAIRSNASDIHFEPYEKSYRVRCRTDGILKQLIAPPISMAGKIAARLKVMARLDISERRTPQDGRIKLKLSERQSIDFRVNTLPTLWGEKIVLRILDSSSTQLGIDALGYDEEQKALYLNALQRPQGLILVTGPTGSGKTVSLYTGLDILNTEQANISTVEDPVEINLEGVNQVNVNSKVGLNFASALRSFLRQDPDIIMVGEIRDLETAQIAVKAAQTGHLVLSTLHTNSAAETLTRLANMGVPAFNIATSVSLIIAQRLARTLCDSCKLPADLPDHILEANGFTADLLQNANVCRAVGCEKCNQGYKGRTGIYEVVPVTDQLATIIMDNGNSLDISAAARSAGFDDLRTTALKKVAQGVISLEEANRVTTD